MGFINPGRNNNSRIAGIRLRDRPSFPPTKGPRCPPKRPPKRSRLSSTPHHRHTPPPPPPLLSRFESLPTEILHSIFTHSHNLHLARASPHLARTLAARSLQLSYVRAQHGDAAGLSHALTLRFFSAAFLALWEARFTRLDCTAAWVPLRGLTRDTALGAALFARGAVLAADQREAHLEVLHGAVAAGRVEVVRLLVETGGLRPSGESLRLAMRTGGLDVCGVLVKGGADVRDVGVWREALALGRGEDGEKAVAWLVREGAVPPGEVLGELSQRGEGEGTSR